MNMAKAVSREYAGQLFFDEINEESFYETVNELLSNPKYSNNAKTIAERFVDRPLSPQQSVLYWTEYAIRHNGAPHLRAAGNNLSFIEFHSIDTYAVLLFAVIFLLYLVFSLLRYLIRKCFKSAPKPAKKAKKN